MAPWPAIERIDDGDLLAPAILGPAELAADDRSRPRDRVGSRMTERAERRPPDHDISKRRRHFLARREHQFRPDHG